MAQNEPQYRVLQRLILEKKATIQEASFELKTLEEEEHKSVVEALLDSKILSSTVWNYRLVNPTRPNPSVSCWPKEIKDIKRVWSQIKNKRVSYPDDLWIEGGGRVKKSVYLRIDSGNGIQLNFSSVPVWEEFVGKHNLVCDHVPD